MHNLGNNYYQSEFETPYQGEQGYELSPELEFEAGYQNEYTGETANQLFPELEFETADGEMSNEFETSLAQELMELNSEAEFGTWLKGVAQKGAGLAANFLTSPAGRQATSMLGNIAKKTLPNLGATAGGALGGRFGGKVGQRIGAYAGRQAGQYAAKRYPDFVRFATKTLQNIAGSGASGGAVSPSVVTPAIVNAAQQHYPSILRPRGTYRRCKCGGHNNGMRNEAETQHEQTGELASEFEYNGEYNGEYNSEYNSEFEGNFSGETSSQEGTFNEVMEMELASELLAVQSEAELDQFLGKLFKKGLGAISSFAKSGAGRALGGMLKGIAKKALPIAGKALGTFIAPGIGTAIGGALGTAASNLFELELEGLSAEDREFEMSRAFVRFAGNAARRAARMRHPNGRFAARQAIMMSARRYAPGLLPYYGNTANNYYGQGSDGNSSNSGNNGSGSEGTSGSWYRQGNRIVIEGA